MRFCPECGTAVTPGAKFCVECAAPLTAAPLTPLPQATAAPHLTLAFGLVFTAILVIGLVAAGLILRQLPQRERELAGAPAQGSARANLPPGHPEVIKIPAEARKFIEELRAKAEAAPKDVAAWDRFGEAAERAAMFDSSYKAQAEDAYAHVLKLDPDDLPALRGIGNIDYDRHHYDEAIAAYEHYLSRKPDDPRVRTDLGTMYLSNGNPDVAITEFKQVVSAHPDFFEAYFNLGVAYAEQNNKPIARSYFLKARSLAPDDQTRAETDQVLAALGGPPTAGESAAVARGNAAAAADGDSAATFQDAFERMVRALPVAGPKVHGVQWIGENRARVLMDDFPMDQMPPFAVARFLSDLKSGTGDLMSSHHVKGPIMIQIADALSNRVMQSVAVDSANAPMAAAPASGGPSVGMASKAGEAASFVSSASSGSFQDAVANMMRNLPVAGTKVASVQWPSTTRAKVMMDNFPMDAMPPFARDKFITDIKSGLESAKSAHKVAGTVTVDIADAYSGRVMASVSE